jgi:PBP1b-binding outer membrane lipoprotein LpoB
LNITLSLNIMKKIFLIVTLTLFLSSCEKDDDMDNKNPSYTENECEGEGF